MSLSVSKEILLYIIDEKIFGLQCDKCMKRFSSNFNLKKHNNVVHDMSFFTDSHFYLPTDDSRKYNCSFCDKSFGDRSNLRKHKMTHLTIEYSCNLCSAVYKNKVAFRRHQQTHVMPAKTTCHLCKKVLSTNSYLLEHIKKVHPGTDKDDLNKVHENDSQILFSTGMFRTFDNMETINFKNS